MLSIGGAVGGVALVAPDLLLRTFGVAGGDLTPAGRLGWRLFAARNIYLTVQATRGGQGAEDAFGPIQALDQAIFWHALYKRDLPRRTSVLAIAASSAIVALDLVRRRGVANS